MSEYDLQLAEWKKRHGLDPSARDTNLDEMAMIAEDATSKRKSWCFGCDKHMPIREMKLITRAIDPYLQTDENEGDYIAKKERVRMCPECFKEKYSET